MISSTLCGTTSRFALAAIALCAATQAVAANGQTASALPAASDAPQAADSVAAPTDTPSSDIIVTGSRAALRAATAEKRDADNFVETLHANDVGKLPDQNVAEAVKRLPGLSVANDQGEGRYVIIRGIDPSLVNVTLNGQTLPAPEPDGRVVKLDDLPSAMIQSVVVTKSLLASQDANAIGGEVNVRTKTAFDSKAPFFFDARGAIGLYGLNKKSPYEVDGTIGGRFGAGETFGAVLSVNYSRRPIESENFQGSSDWTNNIGGVFVPAGRGYRDYNLVRTRLGIVGNFDWRPSDDVKLYIRSSYSKYQDHETRDQNLLAINYPAKGTAAYNALTLSTLPATATILVRHREEDDNTKSVTLGGDFNVGGGKLAMSGGWTRAEKTDPIRSEFTFTGPAVTATYDPSTYPYTLVPNGAAAGIFADPTKFVQSKLKAEHRFTFERIWQGRVDYSHPLAIGTDSSVQVGFKYLDRHKNDDHDLVSYKSAKSANWTLDTVGFLGDTDFYNGQFNFGQRIDWNKAQAYLAAHPNAATFDYSGNLTGSLAPDYDVREKILAGYAMATLKFGNLTVIPGVRLENTRDRTAAKVVGPAINLIAGGIKTDAAYAAALAANNAFNARAVNSYTDWFPGLNVKFEAMPNLLLRGAVTTSIGRPNYSTLAPFITVTPNGQLPAVVNAGNPFLKPYKAVNFDAAIEYYPNKDSLFSAGFFYKDIKNPIYQVIQHNVANPGDIPGASLADYPKLDLTQYTNMDKEFIGGVELNAQTQFTGLPGFLSGFGISANYTHVWGHATGPGFRTGAIPLAYQSHDLGNVSVFYEKYGLTARLAFNYRSAFSDLVGTSAATDSYWDSQGQLDLHVGLQVTPQYTIYVDAANLTDSPWRHYQGSKDFLAEREHYGSTYRIGVQLHF
ncbi:MAG: TonB-dependent receptor [Sphingomonadales bacterium]|nr:TonB-dependent receptor [Sphingomonadales bacterium]